MISMSYIYIKSTNVSRYFLNHMKGTGTILIDEFEKDITLWIMVMQSSGLTLTRGIMIDTLNIIYQDIFRIKYPMNKYD